MKGLIVFKGKYGATAQYASWLKELLSIPVVKADGVNGKMLKEFDTLILGSSVYIGKLLIGSWIKENQDVLMQKKTFLFIVCGTPADQKAEVQKIIDKNIPEALKDRLTIFVLPGKLVMRDISWTDKLLLKMGSIAAKDPAAKKRMVTGFDRLSFDALIPLAKAVMTGTDNKAKSSAEAAMH